MPTIKLREREWEVEITTNGGYEPDTNSHVIEWKFVGNEPGETTEHEDGLIYDQLHQYLADRQDDFYDNVI